MTTVGSVPSRPLARFRPERGAVSVPPAWEVCHALLAWLIALNLADLITTHAVIAAGGVESNPLMAPLVASVWGAVAVKGACLALVVALAFRARHPERVALTLGAVNVWYACVVGWNFAVLAAS